MEIHIKDLCRNFGKNVVLDRVDLLVKNGEVCCLLGTNGAGKTTLINIIIKQITMDSGTIAYDGKIFDQLPESFKYRMGVLSENNFLLDELTAFQYLQLSGRLYGLKPKILERRILDLLTYFFDNLGDIVHKRLSGFSTGMKKVIGIIAAVLHIPDLLILDEPFSGLDPLAAKRCVEFINSYRKENRTVFLSSHDINYVEQVATHIMVLHKQKLIFNGPLAAFTEGDASSMGIALMEHIQPKGDNRKKLEWL